MSLCLRRAALLGRSRHDKEIWKILFNRSMSNLHLSNTELKIRLPNSISFPLDFRLLFAYSLETCPIDDLIYDDKVGDALITDGAASRSLQMRTGNESANHASRRSYFDMVNNGD